ncbi:hypothetical protein CDD83_3516 [Cordyceps sp. RAO-2017]|nr:hypothetical protein CDD83_3516 [Cordyceps sp. RAO-2017]
MSPVICTIITLGGIGKSGKRADVRFKLSAVDKKTWDIEHDASFSRQDAALGNPSVFNPHAWSVTLAELKKCGDEVDLRCWSKARLASLADARRRNPRLVYDRAAAAHIAVEVARVQLALGNKKGVKLANLRELFEHERLPFRLGWRPRMHSATAQDVLELAVESQRLDPVLQRTSNGMVTTRNDLINILKSDIPDFMGVVRETMMRAGFKRRSIYEELDRIEEEKAAASRSGPNRNFNG